ncbi:hypothetical protein BKA69DRAFT_642735 [Paraphysoderma sedebokerense]|nr:hypothetical protein BKA69DRAFT_642735 [Paraphysoderma sedebokerense]
MVPEDSNAAIKEKALHTITEEDIPYEDDLIRNPYSVKSWLRYINHKVAVANIPDSHLIILYERAVKELPGSYKLWKMYLDWRVNRVDRKLGAIFANEGERERVANAFERSLVLLHKMPRIWLMYLEFLTKYLPYRVTKTRRTFDRALRSLPITQHDRIWEIYLTFANFIGGETGVRIWRRYLKLEPTQASAYIKILLGKQNYNEAARQLYQLLKSPSATYSNFTQLCDLLSSHASSVDSIPVTKVLRIGISRYSEAVGKLWVALARWYILKGMFERARDVFEEGIKHVKSVRDFTVIFDAYAEFEEEMVSAKMQMAARRELKMQNGKNGKRHGEEDEEESSDEDEDIDETELDLHLMRLEKLMDRRPFLVNDVLLRQNPNNVKEWLKRVDLCKGDLEKTVSTFTKALTTVNARKTPGLNTIWIAFAKFYESNGDMENARKVFEKAVNVPFNSVPALVEVWKAWAEMELRHDEFDLALETISRACVIPNNKRVNYHDESLPPQARLFKSLPLWSFYVDLSESVSTLEQTKSIYTSILDLKIANPQIVINFAAFLEENQYFEDSFKVYERGIAEFGYPIAWEIWNVYLGKFVKRYAGSKLDRTRDLFEQALEGCPPKFCKSLYLMYAKLEEDFGLVKNAMKIYDRAVKAVSDEDRFEVFTHYVHRATQFFGVTSTRPIYESAIEVLPDSQAAEMCLRYSNVETKLGEIDRARGVLAHGSQFCDPRTNPGYWQTWHEFEVKHGNEDTFKEMLRIKRSVQAKYNTEVNYISAQIVAAQKQQQPGAEPNAEGELELGDVDGESDEDQDEGLNPMQRLESQAQEGTKLKVREGISFVSSNSIGQRQQQVETNPDEISLDVDSDSDANDAVELSSSSKNGKPVDLSLSKQSIPAAVFGKFGEKVGTGKREGRGEDNEDASDSGLGANERSKRRKL